MAHRTHNDPRTVSVRAMIGSAVVSALVFGLLALVYMARIGVL